MTYFSDLLLAGTNAQYLSQCKSNPTTYLQKTGTLYTGSKAREMIGAPGESVKRPKLKRYKVFVQSKGIGYRPLKKGTEILYQKVSTSNLKVQ